MKGMYGMTGNVFFQWRRYTFFDIKVVKDNLDQEFTYLKVCPVSDEKARKFLPILHCT